MGYEVAAGLGVTLAEPLRRVVVMVGDGSYLMMNSEIVTAVAENVNLTVVLIDNRAFMSIRGLQIECGSPSFNNELRHRDRVSGRTDGPVVQLDFVKHASGMGAQAVRADTLAELRSALGHALNGADRRRTSRIWCPSCTDGPAPGSKAWAGPTGCWTTRHPLGLHSAGHHSVAMTSWPAGCWPGTSRPRPAFFWSA